MGEGTGARDARGGQAHRAHRPGGAPARRGVLGRPAAQGRSDRAPEGWGAPRIGREALKVVQLVNVVAEGQGVHRQPGRRAPGGGLGVDRGRGPGHAIEQGGGAGSPGQRVGGLDGDGPVAAIFAGAEGDRVGRAQGLPQPVGRGGGAVGAEEQGAPGAAPGQAQAVAERAPVLRGDARPRRLEAERENTVQIAIQRDPHRRPRLERPAHRVGGEGAVQAGGGFGAHGGGEPGLHPPGPRIFGEDHDLGGARGHGPPVGRQGEAAPAYPVGSAGAFSGSATRCG